MLEMIVAGAIFWIGKFYFWNDIYFRNGALFLYKAYVMDFKAFSVFRRFKTLFYSKVIRCLIC